MTKESTQAWRKRTRKRALQAFDSRCGICGASKQEDLDFHHLDPEEKEFTISDMLKNPAAWSRIAKELRKCVCLCKSCHTGIHHHGLEIPGDIMRFNEEYVAYVSLRPERKVYQKNCNHCGRPFATIWEKTRYCGYPCAAFARRKAERPSKDELWQLIKTTPFTRIGERFGVSDNAVRKWARSYGLPYRKKDIRSGVV